ncbi:MAG: hypothetical protein IJ068_06665 [Bacilli bacterium]|nr:hypothetical protein [Bacilli bacterium]
MKKDLMKIINYYGIKKQLKYLQSEVFELNEAVIQHEESKRNPIDVIVDVLEPVIAMLNNRNPIKTTDAIKDEIADVMVMLKQIQYLYEINDIEITNVMKQKISRQLERIEEEQNAENI